MGLVLILLMLALGVIFIVRRKSPKAKEPFLYRRPNESKRSANLRTRIESFYNSLRNSVKTGFSNYTCFKGRTSRSEFWWWMLFSVSVSILTSFMVVLSIICSLVLLVPNMTMGVRRLHDTNHSGWWYALVLIPSAVFLVFDWSGYIYVAYDSGVGLGLLFIPMLIGEIVNIIWWCKLGDEGNNKYGPNPLATASPAPTKQLSINDEAVEDQETITVVESEQEAEDGRPRYIKID